MRLGKNKTPENHMSATIFVQQHHLQHLIIGFGISSKSSFPHWTLVKQLPQWKTFQKMKQILSKISVLFCHLFIFCLKALMWILTSLAPTL